VPKPPPPAYDPVVAEYDGTTALLVVDVQNDFADPGGSLFVSGSDAVVAEVNREVEAASAAGAVVVYTQDWHPPSTPHFAKDGGIWPVHCVGGTWGADLHPQLRVVEGSELVRKGTGGEDGYSAFSVRDPTSGQVRATDLDDVLRRRGVGRLVVAGLATDYCVKETALDAARRGLPTTVLSALVAAVDLEPGDGDRALQEMAGAGVSIE
jgi:nicotinamidase/pyrazinamidase